MKHLTHLAALCACLTSFPVSAHVQEVMNEPASVYLFSYATVNDAGRSGLKLAWSTVEVGGIRGVAVKCLDITKNSDCEGSSLDCY